jgi:thiamine pyrophosphokinase
MRLERGSCRLDGGSVLKRCFVFAAGSFYGLRERPTPGDFVVAADAGYRLCLRLHIVPDLILGDFDSMEQPRGETHVLRVPVEKDDTDTMLAVKAGLERGCERFYLYGGTGGKRLDHTLANLQTLLWLRRQGAAGYLYDDDFVYTVIQNETLAISKTVEWGLVSVFCLGPEACGITERGLQYALTDASLSAHQPMGVSNHMEAPTATISVRSGALLVGWELPPLPKDVIL